MNALEVITLPHEASRPPEAPSFQRGHYTCHEGRARYTAFLAKELASVSRGPVLDIGCGVGHFLAALGSLHIPAAGFDISVEAVQRASGHTAAKVLRHDANDPWPYPDGSFHAVTMYDVIEHFADYERAIREAHRVLVRKGFMFLVTVNRSSVLRHVLGRRWGALKDPEHVVYFDRKSISSALRGSGFEVEEARTFFNFGVAGESAEFLRPLRVPGILIFVPEFGDSIYVRARKP